MAIAQRRKKLFFISVTGPREELENVKPSYFDYEIQFNENFFCRLSLRHTSGQFRYIKSVEQEINFFKISVHFDITSMIIEVNCLIVLFQLYQCNLEYHKSATKYNIA